MSIEISKFNLPVTSEISDEVSDTRFRKVKIWIAHTGENLNNSYFSKEALGKFAESLPYVPIVGFIEKNDDEEDDFSDHRTAIEIDNGKFKVEYKGKAYGFVPEQPNAKFELRNGREWLTAEGYLWTKFDKAMEIFLASDGVKSQSMEIQDFEGKVDELGRLVFSEGRFSALCMLGDHIEPAMAGSKIQVYSIDKDSIKEMIEEFSLQKGASNLAKKKITKEDDETVIDASELTPSKEVIDMTDLVPDTPVEPEPEPETNPVTEPVTEPDTTETPTDGTTDTTTEEPAAEEPMEDPTDEGDGTFSKKYLQYELSHETIHGKLRELVRSKFRNDQDNDSYSCVTEVFDNHCIVEKHNWETDDNQYFDIQFENKNDEITIGETKEIKVMYVSLDEAKAIEENRSKMDALSTELSALKQFKTEVETAEKEAVLEKFSADLDSEQTEQIRAKFSEFSVQDVEKEIAYACFQAIKNKEEETVGLQTTNFNKNEANDRYGALGRFFQ